MTDPVPRFVDTNVLLRFFVRGDQEKADAARGLFLRVERGEEKIVISSMVVFETVFTLQRTYGVSRDGVRERLLPILSLRSLELVDKATHLRALDLFTANNVSFADAYNVAHMEMRGLAEIYSWDSDFDRFEGVVRLHPGE